jgi:hypothetical protein
MCVPSPCACEASPLSEGFLHACDKWPITTSDRELEAPHVAELSLENLVIFDASGQRYCQIARSRFRS